MKKFQKYCAEVVKKIDRKYKIKRDPQLSIAQLLEELGELAKEINRKKLRGKKAGRIELKNEFADVFLQLAILADIHSIDIESSVKKKIEELKERNYF
ncbi:MAG: MazG nucleotide pyrophosphohydrolase domain-containing protein [Candidatus Moranbacteria bacterium]|nr:MazG nucleotide pyrophosphohydrolase domain-containing protein [Candidatus Moranbacteria bacterium]